MLYSRLCQSLAKLWPKRLLTLNNSIKPNWLGQWAYLGYKPRMRLIYSLQEELDAHPQRMADTQALTLDKSRPFGLKGTYGLFGSPEWWANIEREVSPVQTLAGRITRIYRVGMHNEGQGFEMTLDDGTLYKYSCVANRRKDLSAYQIGKRIEFSMMFDPLKNSTPGATGEPDTHSRVVLKVLVSE